MNPGHESHWLVLGRRKGEAICIGNDIIIEVVEIAKRETGSNSVRLAIQAPPHVTILRAELLDAARTFRGQQAQRQADESENQDNFS